MNRFEILDKKTFVKHRLETKYSFNFKDYKIFVKS